MVFDQNFVPRPNLKKVTFKCSFNQQPPLVAGFVEITNTRAWVTNAYEGFYFNNFIKFGIANDIKKRIIFNGMPGISVNSKEIQQIRN